MYLVEGVHLVREAVDSGQRATIALFDPALLSRSTAGSLLLDQLPAWAERSYEVDERVLSAAAQTETPAGVLAVLSRPATGPLARHERDRFGLILDRLADPGNVGTILRTADAVGVDYVVALAGTVDVLAPKVVRAGMGAHFRLPLYRADSFEQVASALPQTTWVAMEASGSESLYGFSWPERTGLVVGSEAHGVGPKVAELVAHRVRIPMRSGVESLNAAVAASIVLYWALGPEISSAM